MTTIMTASRQWSSRPDDERFTSLIDMQGHFKALRAHSTGRVVSSRSIEVMPVENDPQSLIVAGPAGIGFAPTHWAFGQLAQRAGAGNATAYLRGLPSPIAADCLNYSLRHHREPEDIGVLLYKNGGMPTLRAVTGPNYGRIWNSDIVDALVTRFGDGITGHFRVPGEFGQRVEVTKKNTTLYASDRDMFVFLADEENRIEMANRRDGKPGSLARGFYVWNSEVGKTSWGIAMFLFDYVCSNRIIWGAEEFQEIRGAHTSSAPDRWLENVAPAIEAYSKASAVPVMKAIAAAQQKKIDDVEEFLKKRFNASQSKAFQQVHMAEEGRPIETLWDAATAITAFARELPHQDARVDWERQAGGLLDMAA